MNRYYNIAAIFYIWITICKFDLDIYNGRYIQTDIYK